MKNILKQISLLMFLVILVFGFKADVQAKDWEGLKRNVPIVNPIDGTTTIGFSSWTGKSWSCSVTPYYCNNPIYVSYEVTYNYEEAYKMIDLINVERRKAGVKELKSNDRLMEVAMDRAAETCLYWDHTRPDGTPFSLNDMFASGENMHRGSATATAANASLVNSLGHYANMIRSDYDYVGIGCANNCWVQIFVIGNDFYEVDGYPDRPIDLDSIPLGQKTNYTEIVTTAVDPQRLMFSSTINTLDRKGSYSAPWMESNNVKFYVGERVEIKPFVRTEYNAKDEIAKQTVYLAKPEEYQITNLTPDICSVAEGVLTFTQKGTAEIRVTLVTDSSFTYTLKMNADYPEKGYSVKENGIEYKVSNQVKRTVEVIGKQYGSEATDITIPDSIKIFGNTYKVTSIANKAFDFDRALKKVTIGKNVTKIGKQSFYCCPKLKSIKVKSTKLKSVGKQALTGIHKKAVIKVPKSKLKKYKKLFNGKGQPKTVKIKK